MTAPAGTPAATPATAPPSAALSPAMVSAWQAALAAEQQAVFGYGLVGAHLMDSQPTDSQLAALCAGCETDHGEQVDAISAAMVAGGLSPVAPQADYPSLYPVTTSVQAQALAVRLETDCATAWRYLYAATATVDATDPAATQSHGLRGTAQTQLTANAVRAVRWRAANGSSTPTVPFPGL